MGGMVYFLEKRSGGMVLFLERRRGGMVLLLERRIVAFWFSLVSLPREMLKHGKCWFSLIFSSRDVFCPLRLSRW